MRRLISLLLLIFALLCFPIDAMGQKAATENGPVSPISDMETRGEPFLAKVASEPVKIGRFGGYTVFELDVVRCITERDCTRPIKVFTHLRSGETLKGGDGVVVWEFVERGEGGIEEKSVLVALNANTAMARDFVMTLREKRGSIVPGKPKG